MSLCLCVFARLLRVFCASFARLRMLLLRSSGVEVQRATGHGECWLGRFGCVRHVGRVGCVAGPSGELRIGRTLRGAERRNRGAPAEAPGPTACLGALHCINQRETEREFRDQIYQDI